MKTKYPNIFEPLTVNITFSSLFDRKAYNHSQPYCNDTNGNKLW